MEEEEKVGEEGGGIRKAEDLAQEAKNGLERGVGDETLLTLRHDKVGLYLN